MLRRSSQYCQWVCKEHSDCSQMHSSEVISSRITTAKRLLKSESDGNTADAEDLYQIASRKGRGDDRESDQEAKQNSCRSCRAGETTPRFGRYLRVVRSITRLTTMLSK